ncbi:single-stranded DNA-binding protein [Saccharibacter sp. 17.LH.SD]|uniref:single-stranded DNA-binding protein n=1 Tax=Saccharibacter sp. 17.LH.SD TaxID=2689393 RepID=UPI00136D7163|nr:single-stranded DNA-binding protein [Saccharibacter sp. 17.LH.SD]MXV45250.1 single-stranded DNA-binding protein [Saccharibacter sp. 17.LH.SD]
MAGSVNKVILVGNLGRDPEVRNTQSGAKIVNLTIATSDTWNDRATGERRDRTEWHRVVIFNENIANVAERFLRKGRKVYIEGELRTRKWTGQDGMERYTTEVTIDRFRGNLVLIDSQRSGEGGFEGGYQENNGPSSSSSSGGNYNNQNRGSSSQGGGGWDAPADNGLDDEIPF